MYVQTLTDGIATRINEQSNTGAQHVFTASINGTGAVSATVTLEGSLDGTNWVDTALKTWSLTGTTKNVQSFITVIPFAYYRQTVSSLTGTGAAVVVHIGVN